MCGDTACTLGWADPDVRSAGSNDALNMFTVNPELTQEFQVKIFERSWSHLERMEGTPDGRARSLRHFPKKKAMDLLQARCRPSTASREGVFFGSDAFAGYQPVAPPKRTPVSAAISCE